LFLTCSETGKQNKKPGKAALIKNVLSKNYYRRTLEVPVRQVLQEDWKFRRAASCYKAPSSTLKETVLKASEHFYARGSSEEVGNRENCHTIFPVF
jgi:hypothetical protein